MTTVQLRILGRVQGVGYRAWFADEARARGLVGWVRNRADGSVEARIAGNEIAVTRMVDAARSGPPHAQVDRIDTIDGAPDAAPDVDAKGLDGLRILPTI